MTLQEIIDNTNKGIRVYYKNIWNDVMYVRMHRTGYYYIYNENYGVHPMCSSFITDGELFPLYKEDDFYLKTVEVTKPTLKEYVDERIEELMYDTELDELEYAGNCREKRVLRYIRDNYL